jgi:glutamate-1-semialdehyde aminotransferase
MDFSIVKENCYIKCIKKNLTTNETNTLQINIPCFVGFSCIVANICCYAKPLICYGFPQGVIASHCIIETFVEEKFIIYGHNTTVNNQEQIIATQPTSNNLSLDTENTSGLRHR